MEIVYLDIIMADDSVKGYTIRAIGSKSGFTRSYPMPVTQLLGGTTLAELFQDEFMSPANPTPFVDALAQLQMGFSSKERLEVVGTGLYAMLPSELQRIHQQAWAYVTQDRSRLLRVRLHFDRPDLAMLPWEYMLGPDNAYCVHPQYSLIRYPDGAIAADVPFAITDDKVRVLIWASNPQGIEPIDLTAEIDIISQALKTGLGDAVHITIVRSGDARALVSCLRQPYHIWHYVGPSFFTLHEGGTLLLEPIPGAPGLKVGADQIIPALLKNDKLKLIVLNGSKTATSDLSDPYSSLALSLARYVPAVVGMQGSIADDSALIFSRIFYEQLSFAHSLDASLAEARIELITQYPGQKDWSIPVLCTSAATANLI